MARVDSVDLDGRTVEPIGGHLDNLEKQQADANVRLESLETKVDQRLRETRPVWENVLAQLTKLKKEVDELRAETASGFRGVDRKIGVLSKTWSI